jgi:hypothetical protein
VAGLRAWNEIKEQLSGALGMGRDLLHVPAGLVIFLVLAVLFRRRRHPLLIALSGLTALQLLNEVLDAVQWHAWTGRVNWEEAIEDTALTLAMPLVITAAAWTCQGRTRAHGPKGRAPGAPRGSRKSGSRGRR